MSEMGTKVERRTAKIKVARSVTSLVAGVMAHEEWDDDAAAEASRSASAKFKAADKTWCDVVELNAIECWAVGLTLSRALEADAFDEDGPAVRSSLSAIAERCLTAQKKLDAP